MNEREFLSYMRVVATTNADDPDSHRAHDYAHRLVKKYTAALARAEVLEVAFGNSHQLNEQLGNENRALLARAEAAEAERNELRDERSRAEMAVIYFEARVAELEAALAAQGWRPVTITEPSQNTAVELLVIGYRGHDGYWHYPGGAEGLLIGGWRPEPPDPQEPTP